MNLQQFIQTRLQPLREQKISVSRPTGALDFERRGKYSATEILEMENRPSAESVYLKNHFKSLKDKWGGLELEGNDTHKTETTLADAVKVREQTERAGYQECRAWTEYKDEPTLLSFSVKF